VVVCVVGRTLELKFSGTATADFQNTKQLKNCFDNGQVDKVCVARNEWTDAAQRLVIQETTRSTSKCFENDVAWREYQQGSKTKKDRISDGRNDENNRSFLY
jgi:hypothetical protein